MPAKYENCKADVFLHRILKSRKKYCKIKGITEKEADSTDGSFAVIDFEMPGAESGHICAVGICTVDGYNITDSFYSLVNPQCEFEPFTVELTGIDKESVRNSPYFPEIWEKIMPYLDGRTIVAHGAPCDLRALSKCLISYGIKWRKKIDYICTTTLARECHPEETRFGLEHLCEIHAIKLNHHNALSDAHACAELFVTFSKQLGSVERYIRKYDMLTSRSEKPAKKTHTCPEVTKLLSDRSNAEYMLYQRKLLPHLPSEKLLGVPVPEIRKLASELMSSPLRVRFLKSLPHNYYDENLLHAFMINKIKKPAQCVGALEAFLPFTEYPSVCISLFPACFKRHREEILPWLMKKLLSEEEYTVSFACEMLTRLFCKENFSPEQAQSVANVKLHSEYWENTAARYFSELYLHRQEDALRFLSSDAVNGRIKTKTIRRLKSLKNVSGEKKQLPDIVSLHHSP